MHTLTSLVWAIIIIMGTTASIGLLLYLFPGIVKGLLDDERLLKIRPYMLKEAVSMLRDPATSYNRDVFRRNDETHVFYRSPVTLRHSVYQNAGHLKMWDSDGTLLDLQLEYNAVKTGDPLSPEEQGNFTELLRLLEEKEKQSDR